MTPTANLTETQQHILDCIRRWLARRRFAPTIREIAKATGITSTSVVDYNLKRLEEAGYIRLQGGKARAITLVEDIATPPDPAGDLRAVLTEAASDLDQLAERVYDLDADTLAEAITARAEGLRAALQTAGVAL